MLDTSTACWVQIAMVAAVRGHTPGGWGMYFWKGLDGALIGAVGCGPPAHTFEGLLRGAALDGVRGGPSAVTPDFLHKAKGL